MRYEKNRKILGIDEYKLMRIGKILIIPAIVIILLLVIFLANKAGKKSEEAVEPAQETQAAAVQTAAVADTGAAIEGPTNSAAESIADAAPDDKEYHHDFGNYGLQKDMVPEIRELVAKYQRAKITGDADLMYEVFGRNDNDGREDMRKKLTEEKAAYEAYEDTACYTTPGVEPDSYIVYISSNLRFAGIDTPAPMLTWAYAVKGDDGKYHMKEPDRLTPEEQDAVAQVSASEDVTLLDKELRQNLAQAVVSDPHLAALYQTWSEGYVPVETERWEGPKTTQPSDTGDDAKSADTSESFEEAEIKIGD